MNNNQKYQGSSFLNPVLDLSSNLGYGLVYQTVLSASSIPEDAITRHTISLHRRSFIRRFHEMRRLPRAQ